MSTGTVFWSGLAVAFLALAVVAYRERATVMGRRRELGGMPHVDVPGPVADALAAILAVELVGFFLAAAAAFYTALT